MPKTVEVIFQIQPKSVEVSMGSMTLKTSPLTYDVKLTLEDVKKLRRMKNEYESLGNYRVHRESSGIAALASSHLAKHVKLLSFACQSNNQKDSTVTLTSLLDLAYNIFYLAVVRYIRDLPEATLREIEAVGLAEEQAEARKAAAARQEVARREAALKAAELKAAEQKAAAQVAIQAEQAPDSSQTYAQSLKSLDLMFKYGVGELTDEASLASKLTDSDASLTPAMRLLLLDMIYIMAVHASEVAYSRFAPADEEAFRRVQQFALSENRYQTAQIRMAERIDQAGARHTHQAAEANTDLDLNNVALKAAEEAFRYLQSQASAHPGFFKHTTAASTSPRAEDADFEVAAKALEVQAADINHLDLPPEIFEKLQAHQQHENVTAQPTIF